MLKQCMIVFCFIVPPEILASPGNRAVTVAEKVILTCSVGGDPPPEVIWMKNERPVRLSERIQQLSNGSLVIFDSTVSINSICNSLCIIYILQ